MNDLITDEMVETYELMENGEYITDSDTISIMRNPYIYYELISKIENSVKHVYGIPCSKNMSLNEFYPEGTIDKSQKTGGVTVRFSELFEHCLEELYSEYGLDTLRKADSNSDFVVNNRNFELKTTQGDNFQGATHSSSKCDDYVLIQYKLDWDKKLSLDNNEGLITDLFVALYDGLDNKWWCGQPTSNNSRTTLKIPSESYDEYKDKEIIGSLKQNPKFCKSITENLNGTK